MAVLSIIIYALHDPVFKTKIMALKKPPKLCAFGHWVLTVHRCKVLCFEFFFFMVHCTKKKKKNCTWTLLAKSAAVQKCSRVRPVCEPSHSPCTIHGNYFGIAPWDGWLSLKRLQISGFPANHAEVHDLEFRWLSGLSCSTAVDSSLTNINNINLEEC